jgi:hypothetical protein
VQLVADQGIALVKIAADREIEFALIESCQIILTEPVHPINHPYQLATYDEKYVLDCYITSVNRVAEAAGLSNEDKAIRLSHLLTGEALGTAMRLDPNDCRDYNKLTGTLLKAYDLTGEGFRRKFKSAKVDRGESYHLFGTRIKSYINRWIELTGTEETVDGLKELMRRKQLLEGAPEGLKVF